MSNLHDEIKRLSCRAHYMRPSLSRLWRCVNLLGGLFTHVKLTRWNKAFKLQSALYAPESFQTLTVCKFTRGIIYSVQNRPKLHVIRDSAIISRWRVHPVFGPRGWRSSSPSVVIISDRSSFTVVDCRRPSSCSCLERITTSRHICTVSVSFCSRLKTHLFCRSFLDFL